MIQFLKDNWEVILTILLAIIPVAEIVVRLTPTKADDTVLDWIKQFLNFIPNRKEGGGTHDETK